MYCIEPKNIYIFVLAICKISKVLKYENNHRSFIFSFNDPSGD